MKIVSLVPSASEILCDLGLEQHLVGVSHECNFPSFLKNVQTVTSSNIDSSEAQIEIDTKVRKRVTENKPLYEINSEKLNELSPDLIITHSKHDYHADHRSLSLLTSNAVSHYIPILYCDTLMGVNFLPNYYFDITDHFEKKKEAILKHNSQNPQRFVDLSKLMNSYRAAQCNAPKGTYAEAYSFIPSFPFSDIREILPLALKLRPFHIENQHGFL